MLTRTVAACSAALAIGGGVLLAQTPRPDAAAPFVARLQAAVDRSDSKAVAALFHYPALVIFGGWHIPVNDSPTLVKLYEQLFTPDLRCRIARSAPPRIAGDGLALADGAIWAERDQGQFKIRRLIVPPTTMPRRPPQPPRRVTFADRRFPAQYAGTLTQDDVDSYVISVKRGQKVRARIEGFRARDAVLRGGLATDPDGRQTDLAGATRSWSVLAADPADYRLDVIRLAAFCDPVLTYVLTIAVE